MNSVYGPNPYLLEPQLVQDLPLDLSRKDEKPVQSTTTPSFDLDQFFQTYYLISLRNYNSYMDNIQRHDGQQKQLEISGFTPERVAGFSENNIAGFSEQFSPERKSAKHHGSSHSSPKSERNLSPKLHKKKSRKALLEKVCNCRFCYEDHILRMRLRQQAQSI